MRLRHFLIAVYTVLAIITALYENIWGASNYRGLAYNIGRGLAWPTVWFPSFGHFIGGLIIIIGITYLAIFGKK